MTISFSIRRDFLTIQAYSGTQAIKKDLIRYSALVVQDEDPNTLGVLTPLDIIQQPGNRLSHHQACAFS